MALPHPSELACFEPRPGHSSRLAAMLGSSSGSLSGTEDSVGDAANKEAHQTGVARETLSRSLRSSLSRDELLLRLLLQPGHAMHTGIRQQRYNRQ